MTNAELLDELICMREVGMPVSDNTLNHAREDDLTEYVGISTTDLASLFCELYNVLPGSKLWRDTKSAGE